MKLNSLRISVFKKYFLTTSLIFLVCFTAIVVILSVVFMQFFSNEKFEKLQENCNSVCTVASYNYNSTDYQRNIYSMLMSLSSESDVDIFITDSNGIVDICSCVQKGKKSSCIHTGKVIPKSILNRTVNGKFSEIGNFNGAFDESYYCTGGVIYGGGYEVLGYVFAYSDSSSLIKLYKTLLKLYAVSAIIPLIIMFILLYSITYKMTMPLKRMSEAAQNMAKGNFSKRIPVITADEIGELSKSFNAMTESLQQLENVRRSFIANVSHELKTPMTTISGFIDGILDGTIPFEKQPYYLNIVSQEIKRSSRLVQSMLSMSRLESGETKLNLDRLNFTDLLINIVINQEQRINDKNIDIVGLDEMADLYIIVDKDLIYQAIYNLVDNAIKFTENNGIITFKAEISSDRFKFSINNTGQIIPQDELKFIFDRFYKTDKSRSLDKNGVGIGLHLVKTIIQLHNGDVFAKSDNENGTEFVIVFNKDNIALEENYG